MLFAAMGAVLGASLGDAKSLLHRRLRVGLGLAALTLVVAIPLASYTRNLALIHLTILTGTWTLAFLYYADTVRLLFVPTYRLDFRNVVRLAVVSLIVVLLTSIFAGSVSVGMKRIPATPEVHRLFNDVVYLLVLIFFGARLAFANFALLGRGIVDAAARSWILTTGRTFWPTVCVAAIFYSASLPVSDGMDAIFTAIAPWSWAILRVAWAYAFTLLAGALAYPFLARWMVICESVAGASPIAPPYGHQQL